MTKRSHPQFHDQPRISATQERSPGTDATRAAAAEELSPLLEPDDHEPDYHEPWTVDPVTGDIVNAVGDIIVDPQGCAIATEGSVKEMFDLEATYLARIRVCVNMLAGIPTSELERVLAKRGLPAVDAPAGTEEREQR